MHGGSWVLDPPIQEPLLGAPCVHYGHSVRQASAAIERLKLSKRDRQFPISDRNECVTTFKVFNAV
ncbi:hypothetical protein DM01DRAFT_1339407 [Hesseltinella vesiculosa]|uniref:Uncharacterized protein n=1 Tax=Hesseltinella vesiculosa TaxID=101127 RepID=A0A1X2G707_9FUNG|nr:hypothetical protein DM01DRAFT_1339407 [Hesseltinella vesiculosa]